MKSCGADYLIFYITYTYARLYISKSEAIDTSKEMFLFQNFTKIGRQKDRL